MENGIVKQGKKEFRIADKTERVWELFNEVFIKADYFTEIDGRVKIDIVWVSPEISKTKPVVVKKGGVGERLYGGADFRIEIGTNLWNKLEDNERKYLLLHAANHMALVETKSGDMKLKMNRHDFADFSINMQEFGSAVRNEIAKKNYELHKEDDGEQPDDALKIEI